KIPTLYGEQIQGEGADRHTRLKLNKNGPFPVLPPPPVGLSPATGTEADADSALALPPRQRVYDPMDEPAQALGQLEGDWDAFAAARVWFSYALEALSPPDPEIPGQTLHPIRYPTLQRDPQHMTTIIFRNFPSRAQSYVAERLEEDGWFDDSGWALTG